ncbi:hypothetical protein BZARG_2531 [Bizionia argentinensis JUB59]|uniref:DUF748 domain-containing protein n=1 Tax=Bizionia argentinensis JUB59 TaxID=1046627 RepID=G2EFP9_9FLAO|nr:hypothetical protein BZARG_2531 [Bizionia argentinensis JUB59]
MIVSFVVLLFAFQWIMKSKLEDYIENELPDTLIVTYSDLSLNIFSGSLEVNKIELSKIGETTKETLATLKLDQLRVKNVGYWNYLVNNTIRVSNIQLDNPDVLYNHNAKIQKAAYKPDSNKSFDKIIKVDGFKINNGNIKIMDVEADSLMLQVENTNFSLKDIRFDKNTSEQKIPISYTDLNLIFDTLFFRMGDYEDLTLGKSEIKNQQINFQELTLKTKYSKQELSRIISVERDHYNVKIKSVKLEDFEYGFRQDSIFQFKTPKVTFAEPNAKIYRDKLVTDDESIKPLYSKMLRELNFDLSIDELIIADANISYSEKVKADRQAGTVNFNDFQATIKNVSNTYMSPTKTTLDINTQFMNHAPLHASWEFDVNDVTDLFLFKAEIDLLEASYLNKFLVPNLNVRLEGELDKTYLTIGGTDDLSRIDFKIKYQAFDVIILREDGKEDNKFLSSIANIFVSKDSNKNNSQFIEVSKEGIERSKNQSVFNYIWINTRAGLLKAMTFE